MKGVKNMAGFNWSGAQAINSGNTITEPTGLPEANDTITSFLYSRNIFNTQITRNNMPTPDGSVAGFSNYLLHSDQLALVNIPFSIHAYMRGETSPPILYRADEILFPTDVANAEEYVNNYSERFNSMPGDCAKIVFAKFGSPTHTRTAAAFSHLTLEPYRNLCIALTLSTNHLVRIRRVHGTVFIITNAVSHGLILRTVALLENMFPELDLHDPQWRRLLVEDNIKGYMEKVTALIKEYEVSKSRINKVRMLESVRSSFLQRQMESLDNEVDSCRNAVSRYSAHLNDAYRKLDLALRNQCMLKNSPPVTDESLTNMLDIMATNPAITDIVYQHPKIYFDVTVPVTQFDPEALAILISNTGEYRNLATPIKRALRMLFIEQRDRLIFTSRVYIDLGELTYRGQNDILSRVGVPNPHIYDYQCWGGNEYTIKGYLRSGEFDMALMQIMAGIGNMNFMDGTCTALLFSHLFKQRNRTPSDDRGILYRHPCIIVDGAMQPISWMDYRTLMEKEIENENLAQQTDRPSVPEEPTDIPAGQSAPDIQGDGEDIPILVPRENGT